MINRYQIQYTDSGSATIQKNMVGIAATAKGATAAMAGLQAVMLPLIAIVASFQTLKKTIDVIREFDTTMLEVKAVTRAGAEDFALLTDAARKMGAETRFSASESGQALLELAKIGFDTKQAIAALPATLNLAIAGVIGIERSATIAAITLKQFGLEVSQTTRVTDVLVRAANDSVTSVDGIAQAMENVGPIARAVGYDLETTTAVIETLISSGVGASEAGTSLKNIFLGLSAPSETAKAAILRLGLSLDDISLKQHSLSEIFKTLKKAGMEPGEAEALFGRLGVVGATTLAAYNEQIEIFTARNREAAGVAKETAEIMDSGLNKAFKNLSSITDELMLKMGDAGVKQVLTGLTNVATFLIGALGDLITNLGKVGQILGELYLYWESAFWGFVRIAGYTGFALVQTFTEAFNMIYNIGYDVFSNLGTAIFELIHGGSKTKTVPQIFADNWNKSFQNVTNGWVVATSGIKKEVKGIGEAWNQTDFKSIITNQKSITDTLANQTLAADATTDAVDKLVKVEKEYFDFANNQASFGQAAKNQAFDVKYGFDVESKLPEDYFTSKSQEIQTFAQENQEVIDIFSDSISDSISDAFMNIGDGFEGLMDSITSSIIRMMTSQMVTSFFSFLSGMGGSNGFAGFDLSGFGSYGSSGSSGLSLGMFNNSGGLNRKALGGNYSAGIPRMVGEYGPEIEVPSVSGRILSRSDAMQAVSGNNQPVNVKILNQVDDSTILQALNTVAGERLIINVISKHKNLLGAS